MGFLEKYETIKTKFKENGFDDEAEEILQNQLVLGTPGEVFASVCYYLNQLRLQKSKAYFVAKEEIDELTDYAKSIKYIE